MSARRTRAVLICAVLAPAASALATNKYFVGADGANWNTTASWSLTAAGASGAPVPVAGDDVIIASITSKNVVYNGPSYASALTSLNLNGTSSATVTVSQSGFTFAAVTETIGDTARGAYVQSGGTNTFSNTLTLGNASTSTATYTLSGASSLLSGQIEYVGLNGTGTFQHNGGTNSPTTLNVGYNANATGTYNLTAGSLLAGSEVLGDDANASGSFNQTGGANSVAVLTLAGFKSTAKGSYTLGGGTLAVSGSETIGAVGAGTFTQTAGAHTVSGTLTVSNPSAAGGTLNFNGGSLTAATVNLNPGGAINLADGYSFRFATLNQAGGSLSVPSSTLYVDGTASAPVSTYNLAGGSASAYDEFVATNNSGTFAHSAGTNAVSHYLLIGGLNVGSTGAYSLSGTGVLTVSGNTIIAAAAPSGAAFTQSGGTHTVGNLVLGYTTATTGTYALSGGTLNVTNETVGSKYTPTTVGNFDQTGGTHSVTNAITIYAGSSFSLHAPAASLTAGGISNYGYFSYLNGTLNTYLVNRGTFDFLNSGQSFLGAIDNYGTISLNGTSLVPSVAFLNEVPLSIPAGSSIGADGAGGGIGLVNQSVLTLAGGSLAGAGPISNYGTINGAGYIGGSGGFTNYGSLSPSSGPLAITNTGTNINYATITATPLYQFQIFSNLTNAATLNLNSAIVFSAGGTLTNSPSGLLTGPGSLLSTTFSNAGTLLAPAGTTRIDTPFTNPGLIQLNDTGANLTGASITSAGTIQGFGKVANTIFNYGIIESLNGTLTLAGPTITNVSNGLLTAGPNTKLLITGSFPSNGATINLNGGTFDTNNQALANNNVIAGFGTLRTGGLTNNASITLTGGNTTVTGPVTNTAGHTIEVRYNPATFTGAVVNNGTIKVTGSATVTFAGSYNGTPPSDPSGIDTGAAQDPGFSAPNDGGLTGSGSVVVDSAGTLVTSYLRQSSLTTSGHVTIRPSTAGGQASVLSSLTLTGSASLDLADNNLILDLPNSGAVPAATTQLRQYLLNQNLLSSTAAADLQHRLAIGYADNALLGVTAWGGQPVDSTALVTKMTYLGDANLDGVVNADDYALIDRGFQQHASVWTFGDFNYDGQVNSADYLLIDRVYVQQTGALSPSLLAEREAQFGADYVQALLTSIPEPSSLACLLATLPLLGRRRKH